MLESITLLIIKEKLLDILKVIKKYWQFFLGMTVAIVFFIMTRDTSKAKKTLEKFRESSKRERDRSLEIQVDTQSEVESAVDKFTEDISSASSDFASKEKDIQAEKDKIIEDLLEKENSESGTIASEISSVIDKI